MTEDEILDKISQLYPGAVMELSGENCNFELYIISDDFSGKTTLQRQQSILELFKVELASGKLHALSIKARTPDEQGSATGLIQLKL